MMYFDIEADGLLDPWSEEATRIDCFVGLNDSGEYTEITDGSRVTAPAMIGHNIIGYDLPMLEKHWGWEYTVTPDTLNGVECKFIDTMLLSKLLNPERRHPQGFVQQWRPSYKGEKLPGPHSLEVWGYRLGIEKPKLVYHDLNAPLEDKLEQCRADVRITKALYKHLQLQANEKGLDLKKAYSIEKTVRCIISEGATYGVDFDQELAEECLIDLDDKMKQLEDEVNPLLPKRQLPKSKVKLPPKLLWKKDGTPSANAFKYFGEIVEKDGEWFTGSVNLRDWPKDKPLSGTEAMKISDKEVKDWLINEHDWRPTFFNFKKEGDKKVKTSPKFHEQGKLCPNLEELGDKIEIVKKIVLYLSYRNRRSVIKSKTKDTGWLNHPRLKIDGKLPADADTMGAATFRFTHKVVVNVPRVGSVYGSEMRSLFKAPDGKVMVGWDASGLEDRMKAHYCYDFEGGAEYAEKILDPDFNVHDENMASWMLPRPKCKNGHYAMQYNCRPKKLAETLGVAQQDADMYYSAWWENNKPLEHLNKHLVPVWERHSKKALPCIDGRLVPVQAKYMLTSRLFQSAGAIVMKWAMVLWWMNAKKQGLDAVQVIHNHDEAQVICPPEIADHVGRLGCESIKKAGELLNFRVPLLSEYQVGESWADTH